MKLGAKPGPTWAAPAAHPRAQRAETNEARRLVPLHWSGPWLLRRPGTRVSVHDARSLGGYFLMELLVYVGLVFVLLGIGFAAVYRCIDNSVALRRSADDITGAIHAGERWRVDVRAADRSVRAESGSDQEILRLLSAQSEVDYAFADGTIRRRHGDGPWSTVLEHVKSSSMQAETRQLVTVWRWELELQPHAPASVKPGRVRPLFTFLAVPQPALTP